MRCLFAVAGIWAAFFAAVSAAEDNRVTDVDLKDKFTHKLSEKFGRDSREGNFLTIEKGEQKLGNDKRCAVGFAR